MRLVWIKEITGEGKFYCYAEFFNTSFYAVFLNCLKFKQILMLRKLTQHCKIYQHFNEFSLRFLENRLKVGATWSIILKVPQKFHSRRSLTHTSIWDGKDEMKGVIFEIYFGFLIYGTQT